MWQRVVGCKQTLVGAAQKSAEVGAIRTGIRPVLADVETCLVDGWQRRAKFGRSWAAAGRLRPDSGRAWAGRSGQIWPKPVSIRRAEVATMRGTPDFGHIQPMSAPALYPALNDVLAIPTNFTRWSKSGQVRPNSSRV